MGILKYINCEKFIIDEFYTNIFLNFTLILIIQVIVCNIEYIAQMHILSSLGIFALLYVIIVRN